MVNDKNIRCYPRLSEESSAIRSKPELAPPVNKRPDHWQGYWLSLGLTKIASSLDSGAYFFRHFDLPGNELDIDAVGLWQIIPVGREEFCLNGESLDDFTARHLRALLEAGAVPVRGKAGIDTWIRDNQYGIIHDEIIANIINEWHALGNDPDFSGLWFYRFD